jgi:hypothetical protein
MSSSASANAALAPAVTIVPDGERIEFLPRLFGKRFFFVGEIRTFDFLGRLSPDYKGGFWTFYEQDGEPLFLAPARSEPFRISWHGNGYEGVVSAEAAGIIATLFTLSDLSMDFEDDGLAEAYHRLLAYAGRHSEAADILAAID